MDNKPDLIKANISYNDYARYMPPLASFYQNYIDMNYNNPEKLSDKYFHAKANCQSGQNAIMNALLGLNTGNIEDTLKQVLVLDYGKEIYDILKKNGFNKNGYSLKENLLDSKNDLDADFTGLYNGILDFNGDCNNPLK